MSTAIALANVALVSRLPIASPLRHPADSHPHMTLACQPAWVSQSFSRVLGRAGTLRIADPADASTQAAKCTLIATGGLLIQWIPERLMAALADGFHSTTDVLQ